MKLFGKGNSEITIGIIGGKGQMGQLFTPIFRKQGFKVIISDLNTKLTNKDLVKKSDIVIVSVPILYTEDVIHEIIPSTRQDQILMDFTSLKTFPIKKMVQGNAEVIGLHPMFGPGIKSLKNQRIIICPERTSNKLFIQGMFEKEGVEIHKTTPEIHDKVMGIIQVLIHFHTIILGETLKDLKVDLKEMKKYMSPIYRLEFDMVARIFSQDPYIYGPILTLNPNKKKIINTLEKNAAKLKKTIFKSDMKKFVKDFDSTKTFLHAFAEKASKESDDLIKFMSNL